MLGRTPLPKALFQGWTGTMDSILNVHLSLYCVRVAKREGYLRDDEGAITAGLIDDAVQSIELSSKKSLEEQQISAQKHFQTTCKIWGTCAAKIDSIKTLYSSCKFIYLNRFFCEGAEVLTPLKVFARADKEFNRRFAPVQSQMDTVVGAYRSATDKGADPLVSYFFAMQRCIELAIMTNHTVGSMSTFEVVNMVFAPRGLGGWGLPNYGNFLSGEASDGLVSYTTTMTSLIDVLVEPITKQSVATKLMSTLNQRKAIVGIERMIANPRAVQAIGVIDPAGVITGRIKEGMIAKAKSQVFKSALCSNRTSQERDALADLFRACEWDATIVELLGQCMPESCAAALADRAYKNELVTQLFPFRVRQTLSKKVKSAGFASIVHLSGIPKVIIHAFPTRSDAYELAIRCREEFYSVNDVRIVNHTTPDYMTSMARQMVGFETGISITCELPRASCPESGAQYQNMYDGMPKVASQAVPRSSGAYTFTGARYRNLSPSQKCISKAAITSNYISSQGGNGSLFWHLVTVLWGAKYAIPVPDVQASVKHASSTKRLSSKITKSSHVITAFKNVQSCVSVDAAPVGRYLSVKSTHTDYMSWTTAARTIGLMEMSVAPKGSITVHKPLKINYGFVDGSLILTVPVTLEPFDHDAIQRCLEILSENGDDNLCATLMSSFTDITYSHDEDNEYETITYKRDFTGTESVGNQVHAAPGYITAMLSNAVPTIFAPKIKTHGTVTRGDESVLFNSTSADTRYRRYRNHFPVSQSIVCVMMETVANQVPGGLNMEVATIPWSQVSEKFSTLFPTYLSIWSHTANLAKKYTHDLSKELCRMVLGSVPDSTVQIMASLVDSVTQYSEKEVATIVSTLYLTAHGRGRTADSYRVTSAMGAEYMRKSWRISGKLREAKRGRPDADREFMGHVYKYLGNANITSKLTAFQTLPVAIASWSHKHGYATQFGNEVPDLLSVNGLKENIAWNWIDNMFDSIGKNSSITEKSKRDVFDMIGDIAIMGDIRVVNYDSAELYRAGPPTDAQEIVIPTKYLNN